MAGQYRRQRRMSNTIMARAAERVSVERSALDERGDGGCGARDRCRRGGIEQGLRVKAVLEQGHGARHHKRESHRGGESGQRIRAEQASRGAPEGIQAIGEGGCYQGDRRAQPEKRSDDGDDEAGGGHSLKDLERNRSGIAAIGLADHEQRRDRHEQGCGQGDAHHGTPADQAAANVFDQQPDAGDDQRHRHTDAQDGEDDGDPVLLRAGALIGFGNVPIDAPCGDAVAGDRYFQAEAHAVEVTRVAGAGFPDDVVVAAGFLLFGAGFFQVHGGRCRNPERRQRFGRWRGRHRRRDRPRDGLRG